MLYLPLPTIMNLIYRTMRLGNFMTSCSDKLCHHALSIKSSSIFWSSRLAKCPPANLCFVWHVVRNRKNDLRQKIRLVTIHFEPKKIKVPVTYGRNSVSNLASSNNVATNGVNGRTGNKTWCKCERCAPMETSIECVCCLEIPGICKPSFSSISCLNVCRSDPYFVI